MGFSRQEYWRELPCFPPRYLPKSGTEPASPASPALAGGFFTTSVTWEAHTIDTMHKIGNNKNLLYSSVLCGDLNGKEAQKGRDVCIHTANLLHCAVESNIAL